MAAILERCGGDARGHALAVPLRAADFGGIAAGLRALAIELEQLTAPTSTRAASSSDILRRMLAIKEAVLGAHHQGLLSTLGALVIEARVRQDRLDEEAALSRAAPIIERNLGAQSIALANCLEDRARALLEIDRYPEALAERSVDIWWGLPADRRDDFQAAVNERALASYMVMDGRYEQAERRYRHCIEAIRSAMGPGHPLTTSARSERAWVLMHLGRLDEAEREAREALAAGEGLKESMPIDPRLNQHFYLGSILVGRGKWNEAASFLAVAWDSGQEGAGFKYRPADFPLRQRLVEAMLKICTALGDAECEARWRKELPGGSDQSDPRNESP